MKKRLTRKQLMRNLERLQHLIGVARGCYGNDRDPQRADKVYAVLEEAFELALNSRD